MRRDSKAQKESSRSKGTRNSKENAKNHTKNDSKNSSYSRQRNGVAKSNQRNNQKADPEGLALSKNDIIEFCDRVLKKWQKDPAKNARNIPAMFAVRTSVLFSDEASLEAIWSEIVSWVYQLLYENAQAQARSEGQQWAHVFSKIKDS